MNSVLDKLIGELKAYNFKVSIIEGKHYISHTKKISGEFVVFCRKDYGNTTERTIVEDGKIIGGKSLEDLDILTAIKISFGSRDFGYEKLEEEDNTKDYVFIRDYPKYEKDTYTIAKQPKGDHLYSYNGGLMYTYKGKVVQIELALSGNKLSLSSDEFFEMIGYSQKELNKIVLKFGVNTEDLDR